MEIVELSDDSHARHVWLRWIGLEQPPPAPDAWVPIVRALRISDPSRGTSRVGDRLVEELGKAKIAAYQRTYIWDNSSVSLYGQVTGGVETHVAVLVHERDRAAAVQIARELDRSLEREAAAGALSDEELTRAALEAGPAPEE